MIGSLLRELLDASRLAAAPELSDALAACGIGTGRCPLWGVAWVTTDRHFYAPDAEGQPAVIAGAYDEGRLVDLVATSLRTRAVRRRRGEAHLLGGDAIWDAREADRPLRLFTDGISWLRNSCSGAVVLDWRRAPHELDHLPGVICETPSLARRLVAAFHRPIAPPRITTPQPKEQARAAGQLGTGSELRPRRRYRSAYEDLGR